MGHNAWIQTGEIRDAPFLSLSGPARQILESEKVTFHTNVKLVLYDFLGDLAQT